MHTGLYVVFRIEAVERTRGVSVALQNSLDEQTSQPCGRNRQKEGDDHGVVLRAQVKEQSIPNPYLRSDTVEYLQSRSF